MIRVNRLGTSCPPSVRARAPAQCCPAPPIDVGRSQHGRPPHAAGSGSPGEAAEVARPAEVRGLLVQDGPVRVDEQGNATRAPATLIEDTAQSSTASMGPEVG